MAWRRYLVATTSSSGFEVYPRREEAAWARLVEDLAAIDASGALTNCGPSTSSSESRKQG
jgi:hypothetical protein